MKLISSALLTAAAMAMPAARAADQSLFDELGGKPGIIRIVDTLLPLMQADPRICDNLKEVDMSRLSVRLKEQICVLSDGPCTYRGKDMRTVHEGMHLENKDFNAVVEDLQDAMDRSGIAPAVQNRLLARLAPLQHDVVGQ